nr:PQQ-binding-like beta-propeller repeat protein [Bacteroidota bacterium]
MKMKLKNSALLFGLLMMTFFCFSQQAEKQHKLTPGNILWYHSISMGISTSVSPPLITPQGNVLWVNYTSSGVSNSYISCFGPHGDTIWRKNFSESRFELEPVMVPQLNRILVCSAEELCCLDMNGTELWQVPVAEDFTQSPVYDTSFNIYCASGAKLYSFDSSGTYRWEYDCPYGDIFSPL